MAAKLCINLLPWREALKEKRKQAFYRALILAAGVALFIAAAVSFWLEQRYEEQLARNRYLEQQIARLEAEIGETNELKALLAAMLARKAVIESLEVARIEPVVLFDRLPRLLPAGAALELIERKGSELTLKGIARSNGVVSELMRALEKVRFFQSVRLLETQASQAPVASGVRFTLVARIDHEALVAELARGD